MATSSGTDSSSLEIGVDAATENRMHGRKRYITMRFSRERAASTGVSGKKRGHKPPTATSSVSGSITSTIRVKSWVK